MAGFGAFLTYHFFLYHRKKRKIKKFLNTLTNSDLSVNVQIIYIHVIMHLLYVNYSLQITCLQLSTG